MTIVHVAERVLSDDGLILLFEIGFFAYFLFAAAKRHSLAGMVRRGTVSTRQIIDVSAFVTSAVLGLALNFATFHYRTIVFMVNLAMIFDLFMVNQWSQNQLVGCLHRLRKFTNLGP